MVVLKTAPPDCRRKKIVAGLLHDRMTESVLAGFDDGRTVPPFRAKPLSTVDVLAGGKRRWSQPTARWAWPCPTTKSIT